MATIRHIAIFSDNPATLAQFYVPQFYVAKFYVAQFYVGVYGMKITGKNHGDVRTADRKY